MTADLVSTSLTLHSAVCAAAVYGMWKLGGESKFGTEKLADLHNLRPKLLKSLVGSLELCLNPILTASGVATSVLMDADGNWMPMPAQLSVVGKEALTDAVRDFVKSDSKSLLDLRKAHDLDIRLIQSLNCLRHLVVAIFVCSGLFCMLLGVAKCEWIDLTAAWIHVVSFVIVALFFVSIAYLFWRILNASSHVDHLKSQYAELP